MKKKNELDMIIEKINRYKYLKCRQKYEYKHLGVATRKAITVNGLVNLIRNVKRLDRERGKE